MSHDPEVDRVAHLLKQASKATARALQDRLAARDVAYGHWTILRVLWQAEELSVTALSQRAGVAKPATVTAVQAMEQRGYVTRTKKPGDQKTVYIGLTGRGRALEAELVPLALEVNEIALHGFRETQKTALRKMLSKLLDNLEQYG
ncbi:MarR family winged helix-turn-helix transcriptional regulator [Sinisalibacter aestuarii]|uniref:HTH marR-type domain-containing protein n=1 Tax=Sinisalibacter aestuarii TaxID=2949426 RepID=A0ABQ5LYU3_9RHOB|nr:MarR family transcriptional regulator [Sinisalibacter aestuarii]GKY90114.1 hypothetical protein STA1M1_39830 [Sinisalibacter aestuarii]